MKPRIHGMDALRAIAMLLGVVLHGSIAYKVFPNATWPRDTFQWIGYDLLYLWIHSFRMQVFFLVAGFFARLLYFRIGEQAFLRHRLKRIVIPFMVGVVILVPLSVAPFLYHDYSEWQGMNSSQALVSALKAMVGWNGLAHLWFLYYLLIFYAVMIALVHLADRILIVRNIGDRLSYLANLINPAAVISAVILIVAVLTFSDRIIIEAYTGIKLSLSQFTYYGLFFWIGYWMHHRGNLIEKVATYAVPYLLIGTLLVFPLTYLYTTIYQGVLVGNSYTLLARGIGAGQTVLLTGGVLGGFIRFFSSESQLFRYVSDASYWLYLIHLMLVAWLQVLLSDSAIHGALRFWLVITVTTGIALLTYQGFVRYTIIGNILHGERKRSYSKECTVN